MPLIGRDSAAKAQQFVRDYGEKRFGVSARNLEIAVISTADRTKITFRQAINGVPVYGSSLVLILRGNELIRVQNDLLPCPHCVQIPASITPIQAQASAIRSVQDQGKFAGSGAAAIIYPAQGEYYPAYLVRVESVGKNGTAYDICVDGTTSAILRKTEVVFR